MKRIRLVVLIITAILLYQGSSSYAQSLEKDLLARLDSVTGNEKIMVLNRLSDAVLYKSPQQSLDFAVEALELSKLDSNLNMMTESYLSVAFALRYLGNYKMALDSLYRIINFINDLNDKRLQSQVLNLVGLVHQNMGHDTISLENYFKSFDLAQEINDNYGMISTLNNLGNFYLHAGNYKKSADYFFKCLQVYEEINNTKGMVQMYNNIGTVYQNQGNYEKALEYHLQAFELIKEIPDYTVGLAYVYNNLGACYINTKEYDKSAEYLKKSISICKRLGLYEYLLANYNNLGIVYKEKGKYRIAINYLLEGLKLADKNKNENATSKYLLNIADVYLVEGQYQRALSYFQRALKYNVKLNDFFLLSENNYGIYEVYKKTGNYKKSLEHLEQYLTYRDSLDVITNAKLISETEAQYELDKKEQRINTLQKEYRIQELEIDRKKTNNRILLYGLSALIFIITLVTYLFVQRIKTNKILKEQNRQINNQNEELNLINQKLIQSEQELSKSNQTKDKFLSIIGHDLKNPLLSFKNFIFGIKNNKDELSQEEFKNYTSQMEDSLESVLGLLNNLLQWAKAQKDQISYSEEIINVQEIIDDCVKSLKKQADEKSINIVNNIKPEKIKTDKNMLDFIVRNILSNAIKFSHSDSTIEISEKQDKTYSLIIKDHGIGIPKEYLDHLLNEDTFISSKGTNNESGTGLGLVLCKEFINKMNGSIEIKSEIEKGTSFILKLPILPR